MKVAHLILAHNNPEQLERLVKRLRYADDAVYISLDKKATYADFAHLQTLPNVYFISKRIKVTWASYSIIETTINGFQEIIDSGIDYQYINLLSGTDYPLQTPQQLHRFLEAHSGKAFMKFLSLHDEWQEALTRITKYHFTYYKFWRRNGIERIVNLLLPKRVMPYGLKAVGRSQWFTVPTECISYILAYWQHHPHLRRFAKFTWAPDEFIFQTILYNSPYQNSMVNDDLRYIDWPQNSASPKTLAVNDKDALLQSDKFFARKFNMQSHPDILDVIDVKLNQQSV